MPDEISLNEEQKEIDHGNSRFQKLVEQAPIGICIINAITLVAEILNERFVQVAGKPYKTILGSYYWDTFAEAAPYYETALQDVVDKGVKFTADEVELMLIRDGKPDYINVTFVYDPIKGEDGTTQKVAIWVVENTERVRAQKKIEDNEHALRNIILQAPVAMCIFRGAEFIIEIANEKMFEFWGRGSDDIIGKPVFEALPEAKNQGYEELLSNVFITGDSFTANELPVVLPRNGKRENVFVNFSYEPIREVDNSISGIIAVAIDVTKQVTNRHNIESEVAERTRELAEVNQRLQQNNKELQQFAYIASHDLQEPVRKVFTYTQMLEKNLVAVDERSATYIKKIAAASHKMLALIRDVLSFSQLSREREQFKQVNLADIVENIKNDFELLIEEKQAVIQSKNLPVLAAIPLQMNQLFGNLVSNALKFSKKDTAPVIEITGKTLSKEALSKYKDLNQSLEYYLIQVSDYGIGFNQENADIIFDIFQRLNSTVEYEGTGIGLAICKKIAINHNGNLTARSGLNNGATFNIFLPKSR